MKTSIPMNSIIVSDITELLVLTLLFYKILLWIDYDKSRKIIVNLYGYLIVIGIAVFFNLAALQQFFYFVWIPGCVIYYLLNQKQLQQNYVKLGENNTLINITEHQQSIETLIKTGIHFLYKNKNCFYILERKDRLNDYVQGKITLNSPLSLELLELLAQNTDDESLSCIIKDNSILSSHLILNGHEINNTNILRLEELLHIIPLETDALIIIGYHSTKQWKLITQKHIYSELTTKDILTIAQYYLYQESIHPYEQSYDKKSTVSQEHSL